MFEQDLQNVQVARWFEGLLDTLKIVTPHTHAVDDHTDAMFNAIERERDIDTDATVTAVSHHQNQ